TRLDVNVKQTTNGTTSIVSVNQPIQCITAMPEYKAFSRAELRVADYAKGHKSKSDVGGATGGFGSTFGSGIGFGSTLGRTGGGFGSGGGFGQTSTSQPANTTFGATGTQSAGFGSGFGSAAQNQTSSAFGSTGGGFGSQPSTSSGLFGQTSSGSTGFGLSNTSGSTAFGQPSSTSGTTGFPSSGSSFGGFGGGTQNQTSTGFGSQTTSGFGSSTNKPGGLFGSSTTGTGFGNTGGTGTSGSSGFGTFGSGTGGGFGTGNTSTGSGFGSSTTGFGTTGTSSGFGGTGGGFGSTTGTTGGSLFGGTQTNTGNTGTTGFGSGFGTQTSTAGGTGTGSSLFGSGGGTAGGLGSNTGGSSLFGGGTSTFGSGSTGFGGFGGTSTANAPTNAAAGTGTGTGLFGSTLTTKPATTSTGLFGSTSTGGGGFGGSSLFGNTGTGATTNTASTGTGFGGSGGGLFGSGPSATGTTTTGTGGFGTFSSGGGLLSANNAGNTSVPLLQAQVNQNPYGTNPLFATMLSTASASDASKGSRLNPLATPIRSQGPGVDAGVATPMSKKRPINVHQLTTPRSAMSASRLRSRGFTTATPGSLAPTSSSLAPSTPRPKTPSGGAGGANLGLFGKDGFLSPDMRIPRTSVKKLVVTKKPSFSLSHTSGKTPQKAGASPADVQGSASGKSGTADASTASPVPQGAGTATNSPLVSHSPHISIDGGAPGEKMNGAQSSEDTFYSIRKGELRGRSKMLGASGESGVASPEVARETPEYGEEPAPQYEDEVDDAAHDPSEYWMSPSLEELRAMPPKRLQSVKDFTVGRYGVGQVRFLRRVDLTKVGSLSAIAGGVIIFSDRVCTVYPDENLKPPRGEGLNVPARISLDNCWPIDKATRKPITKIDDPRVKKHIKRLKKIPEIEFEDFINGTWIFKVQHFSTYGMDDVEETDDEEGEQQSRQQGFGEATAANVWARRAVATEGPESGRPIGGSGSSSSSEAPRFAPHPASKDAEDESDDSLYKAVSLNTPTSSEDEGNCFYDDDGGDGIYRAAGEFRPKRGEARRSAGGVDDNNNGDNDNDNNNSGLGGHHGTPSNPTSSQAARLAMGAALSSARLGALPGRVGSLNSQVKQVSLFQTSSQPLSAQDGHAPRGAQRATSMGITASPFRASATRVPPTPHRGVSMKRALGSRGDEGNAHPSIIDTRASFGRGRLSERPSSASAGTRRRKSQFLSVDAELEAATLPTTPAFKEPPRKYMRTLASGVYRESVPYSVSVAHGQSNCGIDAGLMMARSSRVGFGVDGVLVRVVNVLCSQGGTAPTSRIIIEKLPLFADQRYSYYHSLGDGCGAPAVASAQPKETEEERANSESAGTRETAEQWLEQQRVRHHALLEFQLDKSMIVVDKATKVPHVQSNPASPATFGMVGSLLSSSSAFSGRDALLWRLAEALFDEIPKATAIDSLVAAGSDKQRKDHLENIRRKQRLTLWLKSAVEGSVQQDLLAASSSSSPSAVSVWAHLTAHNIDVACLTAVSHRDYHLATLLSQVGQGCTGGGGSEVSFRNDIQAQLRQWRQSRTDEFVGKHYRRIYELLAGNMDLSVTGDPAQRSRLDLCLGLDWKRAFGMHLWYGGDVNSAVDRAIERYTEAFTSHHAAPPLPSWALGEQRRHLTRTLADWASQAPEGVAPSLVSSREWDGAYQLLLLFANPAYSLERALSPRSFTPSRADMLWPYMFAWLFSKVRSQRGFEDAPFSMDLILVQFASQLEQLGLWQWAVFVLLHLSSPRARELAVRQLLVRSAKPSVGSGVEALAADSGNGRPADAEWPADTQDIRSADWASDGEVFVVTKLRIPIEWLYEAKSIHARYDRSWTETHSEGDLIADNPANRSQLMWSSWRDSYEQDKDEYSQRSGGPDARQRLALAPLARCLLDETRWLLLDGRYYTAHSLVMRRIAPDAILRADYELLRRILAPLKRAAQQGGLSSEAWECGGEIYDTFLSLSKDLPELLRQITAHDNSQMADIETYSHLTKQVEFMYAQMTQLLRNLPVLSARYTPHNYSSSKGGGVQSRRTDGSSADQWNIEWLSPNESNTAELKRDVAITHMAAIVSSMVQEMDAIRVQAGGAAAESASVVSTPGSTRKSMVPQQRQQSPFAKRPAEDADVDDPFLDHAMLVTELPLAQDQRLSRLHKMAETCFSSLITSDLSN
ncbi:hypothetical protein EV182_000909, partial [Spiromyces aspiralis]